MTILRLDAAGPPLTEIDLGEPTASTLPEVNGWFDNGDLSGTSGNLYLYLDGVEYGSLFFTVNADGLPQITLGQFDQQAQQWVERSTLTCSVDDTHTKEIDS